MAAARGQRLDAGRSLRFVMRAISTVQSLILIAAFALSGCGIAIDPEERPFSKAVDDFNTRTELNARLLAEDPQMFNDISPSVIAGRVHLPGNVPTEEQRRSAT